MSCSKLADPKAETNVDTDSGFVDDNHTFKNATTSKRKYTSDTKQFDNRVTSSGNPIKLIRFTPNPPNLKRAYFLSNCKRNPKYLHEVPKWIEPDEDGDTDLHIILSKNFSQNNNAIAELIIDNVERPDALDMRNNQGLTPIIIAAAQGHSSLIIRLRVAGANPNTSDGYGNTPLHHAVTNNHAEVIQSLNVTLLEEDINTHCSNPKQHQRYRTNYNMKNCDGKTPLFLATERRNVVLIRSLLRCGADPNIIENCAGRTALHNAVESADLACIEELLKFNTNVNANTYAGSTPLDVAQQLSGEVRQKIISKLHAHGGTRGLEYEDKD